jgi:xanthine/CO dehydrogenase XdhC/CoxF family maturation factor
VHLAFELADARAPGGAGRGAAMKTAGAWWPWTALRPGPARRAGAPLQGSGAGFPARPRHPPAARPGWPPLAGRPRRRAARPPDAVRRRPRRRGHRARPGELPCRVTWVDERDDLFPANLPHNVTVEATDTPEALAASAAPGTSFLVMTHSHALDQRLAEAILKRPAADWFGLIGSRYQTQAVRAPPARARRRAARIDAMVCPIGVPGIEGKAPAVIAVAVAAQLLMVWEGAPASRFNRKN